MKMTGIHKHRTPQQVLEWYPHPIPQPDSEEARQARVGRQFRLYFLADASKKMLKLGKKPASAAREQKARALRLEVEEMNRLMLTPRNEFLVETHAWFVEMLLDDLRELIG